MIVIQGVNSRIVGIHIFYNIIVLCFYNKYAIVSYITISINFNIENIYLCYSNVLDFNID